jgi:DUF4097 and DUF4098 domain-containing protein YvlB
MKRMAIWAALTVVLAPAFAAAAQAGTLKLQTVNGGIEVTMPGGLSADVLASTVNGDISTDFPLTVRGKIARRKLEGTIGAAGRTIEMKTVNGSIDLKKHI